MNTPVPKRKLSSEQTTALLETLKTRFEKNTRRHQGIDWAKVRARLDAHPEKLSSLHEIEATGGYHELQALGEFDQKSSSWVKTPPELRELGGALFGDRRYGRVFIYHNGAQSYYDGRGFRGSLRV
jgi:Protein of unknown function (DUF4256)